MYSIFKIISKNIQKHQRTYQVVYTEEFTYFSSTFISKFMHLFKFRIEYPILSKVGNYNNKYKLHLLKSVWWSACTTISGAVLKEKVPAIVLLFISKVLYH